MRLLSAAVCIVVGLVSCAVFKVPSTGSGAPGNLEVYFLDMMGGGSTLIVTPSGESVLIDTGSLEPRHRDAERIYRATQYAGLKQIDHLITTHFHSDHYGGLRQLSQLIPIKKFYDKGAPAPAADRDQVAQLDPLYREVTKGRITPIRAGDDLALRNGPARGNPPVRLHCVAAEKKAEGFDGDVDAAVEGYEIRKPDLGDNARSIALVLTYGDFKLFAGGDITWNVEQHLAVPKNVVGKVDVYQVTHHGLDLSNNPVLLKELAPTVCVAMNGPRKGIQPNAFRAIQALPSVQALYQIHYNTQYGKEGNTAPEFIANMQDPKKGELIKVSVNPSAESYTVSLGVNGPRRTFATTNKQ